MKNSKKIDQFRQSILQWYDENRRVLPWRALPGQVANPYHVWLSEVMLQQTLVNAVIPYFLKFTEQWPTIHDLANAPQDDVMAAWAGLGYYARARNLHKCAKVASRNLNGVFPTDEKELKQLPGIGDYTAAAIASIAFDRPAVVVDGNIERVMARYFAITEPLPTGKKAIKAKAADLAQGRADRPSDYAQALMDLGAGVCIAKTPRCALCPLHKSCQGYQKGIAAQLPARAPKKEKPQKWGYIYWITNAQGEVLIDRRPETEMLGGMSGLPTSPWVKNGETLPEESGLDPVLSIRHSFTHFDLELHGIRINLQNDEKNNFAEDAVRYRWKAAGEVEKMAFPTLFKKFVRLVCVKIDA